MTIIKDSVKGKWKLDVRVGKENKRYRKWFETKRECTEYIDFLKRRYEEGKPWKGEEEDRRHLEVLIDIWFNAKGCHLADGERQKRVLKSISLILGNPVARNLTVRDFNEYKAIKKSKRGRNRPVMDKTINNHLAYLRAMYSTLIKTKDIKYRNPLEDAEMIKTQQPELAYLTSQQVQELLREIDKGCINPHVKYITRLCLSTGARWGEVESRALYHLKDNRIEYSNTKGKKTRTIPVEPELFGKVYEHLRENKRFTSSLSAFRRALRRSGLELPKGQASHVLRHTFASHFMMNGGNILVLQKILGHSDIAMTMKYAKFDPSHLQDATRLNPLTNCPPTDSTPESRLNKQDGHFLDTSSYHTSVAQ
ncbi:hypothetical protein ACH42_08260 [Endozoicomonas sp. (ex Bugula neritina AB1)]|nr:hypothetical protein ACH42_08260 [Endozoicomonas sp. (ex Bugula neritina AB1)]